MKKRVLSTLSLLLALSACGGPAVQTGAPAQTVPEPSPSPSPSAPANGGVFTDWSGLEADGPDAFPELLYSRWYEEPVHDLIPLDGGYGTLVPFVGSFPPDRSWGGVYQYGLMTMDGTIVVDATYGDVNRLICYDSQWAVSSRLPVLSLMESDYAYDEENGYARGAQRFGACALDGSWAIPVEYEGIRVFAEDGFFLWKEDVVYSYGLDGRPLTSFDYPGAAQMSEYDTSQDWYSGVLTTSDGNGGILIVDLHTGGTTPLEGVTGTWWIGGDLFSVYTGGLLCGCVDKTGRWVLPAEYHDVSYDSVADVLSARTADGQELWFDCEGRALPGPPEREAAPIQTEPEPPVPNAWPFEDCYTGITYYCKSTGNGYDVLDAGGTALGHSYASNDAGTETKSVVNGLVLSIDDLTAGYKDLDGNWIFRILLAEAGED